MGIEFIQYVRPRGQPKLIVISRPREIENLADKLLSLEYIFEAEVLRDERVSLTCEYNGADEPDPITAAIEIVPNGIEVLTAVDCLVRRAWKYEQERKDGKAEIPGGGHEREGGDR